MIDPTGKQGRDPDSGESESVVALSPVDGDADHWTPERMRQAKPAERRLDPEQASDTEPDAEQFED